MGAVTRGYFIAPCWLAFDDGLRIELFEFPARDRLEFSGSVREAIVAGQVSPALAAMGRASAALGRLVEALRVQGPQPLDRASLLRGSGFSQLFVELTARCNERCVHCYAESSPERDEVLSRELLAPVLEDAAQLGFTAVQLTGGDPLVSPHCLWAARRVRELGIRQLEIYSNGLLLTGRTYDELRELRAGFAFSFYSHRPEVHDAITRTPDSQRRTLRAIRTAVADGMDVRAAIIVMEQNQHDVEQTLETLRQAGVPDERIGLDVQRSVGRGLMTLGSGALPRRTASAGHRAAEVAELPGRACVSYTGMVYPCIFSRGVPLGNVREQSLRRILLAPEPVAVDRDRLRQAGAGRGAQLSCWDCRLRVGLLT